MLIPIPGHSITETEVKTKRLDQGPANTINGVNCEAGYVLMSNGDAFPITAWMDQDNNLTADRLQACMVFYEREGRTLMIELETAHGHGVVIDGDTFH